MLQCMLCFAISMLNLAYYGFSVENVWKRNFVSVDNPTAGRVTVCHVIWGFSAHFGIVQCSVLHTLTLLYHLCSSVVRSTMYSHIREEYNYTTCCGESYDINVAFVRNE